MRMVHDERHCQSLSKFSTEKFLREFIVNHSHTEISALFSGEFIMNHSIDESILRESLKKSQQERFFGEFMMNHSHDEFHLRRSLEKLSWIILMMNLT